MMNGTQAHEENTGALDPRQGMPAAGRLGADIVAAAKEAKPDYRAMAAMFRRAEELGIGAALADSVANRIDERHLLSIVAQGLLSPEQLADWVFDGVIRVRCHPTSMRAIAAGYGKRMVGELWDRHCIDLVNALVTVDPDGFEQHFDAISVYLRVYGLFLRCIDQSDFSPAKHFRLQSVLGSFEQFQQFFTLTPMVWSTQHRRATINVAGPSIEGRDFSGTLTLSHCDKGLRLCFENREGETIALNHGDRRFLLGVLLDRVENQGGATKINGIQADTTQNIFESTGLGMRHSDFSMVRADALHGFPSAEIRHEASGLCVRATRGPHDHAWAVLVLPDQQKSVHFKLDDDARSFVNQVASAQI